MAINPSPELTASQEARSFLAPETALHRQYEALRAYFVERLPFHQVASRFGYTAGSFRVLCHPFRHDPHWRPACCPSARQEPSPPPARHRVRDLVVAMRKRNLSVYDIQRERAEAGRRLSINALSTLLHEEGFARLP